MPGLENDLRELLYRHEVHADHIDELWQEVVKAHSSPGRHYHTLQHLEDLRAQLAEVTADLQDPDAVLLAIAYHDLTYRVSRKDNEERSAGVMLERMLVAPDLPGPIVPRAAAHIRATRRHEASADPDTDPFTDADLSILGSSRERYKLCTQQVRREYRRYPDMLYKPGRRKVLAHFLAMPHIFKTAYFRDRYEEQARFNMEAELKGAL